MFAGRRLRGIVGTAVLLTMLALLLPGPVLGLQGQDAKPAAAAAPPDGGLVPSAAQFGFTPGEFSVSDDGAAGYEVPLWVPDGRGGLQPSLRMKYDSRADNGLLGVGWRLDGMSSIRPCPRTPAQDGYSDSVHFDGGDAYCLDGMRLNPTTPAQQPQRSYRTERESFSEITAIGTQDNLPDYFTVENNRGQTLYFGQVEGARLEALELKATNNLQQPGLEPESDQPVTVEWALNRIEDRNGNAASVTYQKSQGDSTNLWGARLQPSTISYEPDRTVRFSYELRPDHVDRFTHGVHVRTIHRLTGITMSAGGAQEVVRKYNLTYRNTSTTGRSQLTEVAECDADGACKVPQSFGYAQGSYQYTNVDTNIDPDITNNKLMTGDINGDGRDDLLYPNSQNRWRIRFSTGNGFGAEADSGLGTISPTELGRLRTVDFDRDGKVDVMAEIQRAAGPGQPIDRKDWVLYQSNGTKFVPYIQDVDDETADEEPDPVYFGDLDGNGMPDFASATYDNDTRQGGPWYFRLNTGKPGNGRFAPKVTSTLPRLVSVGTSAVDFDGDGRTELVGWNGEPGDTARTKAFGLRQDGTVEPVPGNVNVTGDAGTRLFGDVNGDGLEDAVYPYNGLRAQLNSARGFGPKTTSPSGYKNPEPETDGSLSKGVRLVDANGDGAQDVLIFFRTLAGQPNDGTRGVHLWVWDSKGGGFVRAPLQQVAGFALGQTQPLDLDGDGDLDIAYFNGPEIHVLKRDGGVPDRMTRAGIEPGGRRVRFDYAPLSDRTVHTPGTCAGYPQLCPGAGGFVVSAHHLGNPQQSGGWSDFEHEYEGARTDLRGRGLLGFAKHTVRDLRNGGEVATEFDNTTVDATSGLPAVYPYARLPKRIVTFAGSATGSHAFRQTVTNDRRVRRVSGGGYTVELRGVDVQEQERPAGATAWRAPYRTRSTTTDFDAFGNKTRIVTGAGFGRRTTVQTTYADDEDRRLNLPDKVVTTGCLLDDECARREATFDYDDNGNLTQTEVEPTGDDSVRLRTTTAYGTAGTITSVTAGSRVTRFGYDAELLYPVTETNARGHVSRTKMHSGLGVVLESSDPNDVRSTMKYDKFGRIREVHHSDGASERINHLNFLGGMVTTSERADGSGAMAITDPLGRELETRDRSFSGAWSSVITGYDAMGRIATETRPSTSGTSPYKTTYGYDHRDRLVSRAEPDGATVRYSFDGLTTTMTDARGFASSVVRTIDGDIGSRRETAAPSEGVLTTTYGYGPLGELTKVVAPDGSTQTMSYDARGRRTRLSDPSAGVTVTAYDAFGDVVSTTDGNDDTTRFDRDALGRVTKITSPDGVATNTWDTAPHGLGLLARATSTDGVATNYVYDDLSRTATETRTIAGTAYQVGYGYDTVGRQNSITYPAIPGVPDRLKVGYTFNPHGYLLQVTNTADGKPYWTAQGRNADGALTKERFGNQVTTEHTYDAKTGVRTDLLTAGPGGQLQKLHLDYDLNRNLDGRTDQVSGWTDSYSYDRLNRLSQWTGGALSTARTSYQYDKVGNLVNESVLDEPERDVVYRYGENGAPRHALTSRNSDTYRYDAAGQQIAGPQRGVSYNRLGLPKSVTWGQPARTTQYQYDADGVRVRKQDAEQTVVYVPGVLETRKPAGTGNTEIHNLHNIVVGGRVVAQVNRVQAAGGGPVIATEQMYLHPDHQGSTTVVSNAAGRRAGGPGDFLNELFYDPFGSRLDSEGLRLGHQRHGGPRQGYTGHEHEDETGLINMAGRIYDPEARRFLSPDPLVSDPLSGQGLNRYSYVANNPASYVDPSGYQRQQPDDCGDCVGNETVYVTPVDVTAPPPPFDLGGWVRGWGDRPGNEDIRDIARGAREFGLEFLRDLGVRRRALDAAAEQRKNVAGQAGPYTITAEALVWDKPALKLKAFGAGYDLKKGASTGGPGWSIGGGLTLGKVEAKAQTTAGGFGLEHTISAEGPSVSSGVGCSVTSVSCTISGSVSLASVGTCVKACTPVIELCAKFCGGATVGIGGDIKVGADEVELEGKYGVLEGSVGVGYEGVNENVLRAASAPGPGRFWAVRSLMGW